MASNYRRKRYRIRYDRIIFVGAIFIVLILILTACVKSCTSKDIKPNKNNNSIVDNMSSTETPGQNNSSVIITTTEPQITHAEATLHATDVHKGDLILVNAANPCRFDSVAIENGISDDVQFVTIKSVLDSRSKPLPYTAKDWEVGMDKDAAMALDTWLADFYRTSGNNDIRMIAGYRSDSEDLDYRTGRTCKLGIFPETGSSYFYKNEGTFAWVASNAKNYGYILRYPDGKEGFFDDTITPNTSATFRYVGVAAATYIAENNICLEEYLLTVKSYTIDNMLRITNGGTNYGVYYVPANSNGDTRFSVPADPNSYEVSGNNMDGFVVTVTLNGTAAEIPEATQPATNTIIFN